MDESTLTRRDVVGMLAGWGLALRAADLRAQDAAKVDPRGYKIRYENEQIRVLEFTAKPRLGVCGQGMHFHSDHVNILLTDATVRVTTPDGKTFVPPADRAGDVWFEAGGAHSVENIGGDETRAFMIEFKTPATKAWARMGGGSRRADDGRGTG